MPDRYAVIGNSVAHSKSPEIHAAFANQTGQDMVYERIRGSDDRFEHQVREFLTHGGRGLNVTVPFKERACQLATELSDRAKDAGAVNTLIVTREGELRGDNSDGIGLLRDLSRNHHITLTGSRILLLGAGGASRGVMRHLLDQGPELLVIANRTVDKARLLARQLATPAKVEGCGLADLAGQTFDLIVNGTSAGLNGGIPDIPRNILTPGGSTYDMMYADKPTDFVRWGKSQGARNALDGLGMLVEQAAESFYLWRGVRPFTQPVIAMLRAPTE